MRGCCSAFEAATMGHMMLALGWIGAWVRRHAIPPLTTAGTRRRVAAGGLLVGALVTGCAQPRAAGPPAPSRVGYERLQQAYAVWQLLDRARDTTARLKSWRELDPESGSSWDYAIPNRSHYRFFGMDG